MLSSLIPHRSVFLFSSNQSSFFSITSSTTTIFLLYFAVDVGMGQSSFLSFYPFYDLLSHNDLQIFIFIRDFTLNSRFIYHCLLHVIYLLPSKQACKRQSLTLRKAIIPSVFQISIKGTVKFLKPVTKRSSFILLSSLSI